MVIQMEEETHTVASAEKMFQDLIALEKLIYEKKRRTSHPTLEKASSRMEDS